MLEVAETTLHPAARSFGSIRIRRVVRSDSWLIRGLWAPYAKHVQSSCGGLLCPGLQRGYKKLRASHNVGPVGCGLPVADMDEEAARIGGNRLFQRIQG